MHQIIVKRQIQAPLSTVYHNVWDIKSWSSFWNPLQEIEVSYDDGHYQDFKMLVHWQSNDCWVRTIRFSNPNGDIAFFSPQPPPPTTIHQGLWQFKFITINMTELTSVRIFELPLLVEERVIDYKIRFEKFSKDFEIRLQHLLQKLGELCESQM